MGSNSRSAPDGVARAWAVWCRPSSVRLVAFEQPRLLLEPLHGATFVLHRPPQERAVLHAEVALPNVGPLTVETAAVIAEAVERAGRTGDSRAFHAPLRGRAGAKDGRVVPAQHSLHQRLLREHQQQQQQTQQPEQAEQERGSSSADGSHATEEVPYPSSLCTLMQRHSGGGRRWSTMHVRWRGGEGRGETGSGGGCSAGNGQEWSMQGLSLLLLQSSLMLCPLLLRLLLLFPQPHRSLLLLFPQLLLDEPRLLPLLL